MDDSNEAKHCQSLKHSSQEENGNSQKHENQLDTPKRERIGKKIQNWAPIFISLIATIIAALTFYLLLHAEWRAEEAKIRAEEAEQRAIRSEKSAEEAEQRAIRSEKSAEEAEQRAIRSEKRAEEAEQREIRSEKRAEEAEQRAIRSEKRLIGEKERAKKVLIEKNLSEALDLINNRRGASFTFDIDKNSSNLELARRKIDEALIIDPHYGKAHRYKGLYHEVIEELDDSINSYYWAIENEPSSPSNYINLGVALTRKQKFKEAEFAYEKAEDLGGNKIIILMNKGYLYSKQGVKGRSKKFYRKAAHLINSQDGKFSLEFKQIKGLEAAGLEEVLKEIESMPRPPTDMKIID